jgi:hypothetical protein
MDRHGLRPRDDALGGVRHRERSAAIQVLVRHCERSAAIHAPAPSRNGIPGGTEPVLVFAIFRISHRIVF